MNFHCVRTGVKAEDVTIDDLTIPDSYCNPKKGGGTIHISRLRHI